MKQNPFSRYQVATGSEAEFQPGSRGRVLINKLGIARKKEMDQIEYDSLILIQKKYLTTFGNDTCFTAEIIRKMHHGWLRGIYPWAGTYRTVEVSKEGFAWPPAFRIAENMHNLEQGLLRSLTPCQQDSLEIVAHSLAIIHAELLLIHPFRDGNGRVARWLADLMANQARFPAPSYDFAGKGMLRRKRRYIQAVQKGYVRRYDDLTDFFAAALRRGLEEAGKASGFGSRAPSTTEE